MERGGAVASVGRSMNPLSNAPAELGSTVTHRGRDPLEQARRAADQVFDETPVSFEPTNAEEARAAVERLNERFAALPGSILRALGTARSSGTLLSSNRLQGLAEIVQNADDVKASEVRFLLRPTDLLVSHNGTPVCLADVQALATPWLTTKADDATTTGRFGIGLSALQSLSTTLEVHCAPYHVRIGDPFVAPVEPPGHRRRRPRSAGHSRGPRCSATASRATPCEGRCRPGRQARR